MDIEAHLQGRKPWPNLMVGFLLLALLGALLLSFWRGVLHIQQDNQERLFLTWGNQFEARVSERLQHYEGVFSELNTLAAQAQHLDETVQLNPALWLGYPELEPFTLAYQGQSAALAIQPVLPFRSAPSLVLDQLTRERLLQWQRLDPEVKPALWLFPDETTQAYVLMPGATLADGALALVGVKIDLTLLISTLLTGSVGPYHAQLSSFDGQQLDRKPSPTELNLSFAALGQSWLLQLRAQPLVPVALRVLQVRWVMAFVVLLAFVVFMLLRIRSRVQLNRDLEQQIDAFRSFQLGFETLPQMAVLLDDKYRIRQINQCAQQWLEQSSSQLMQQPIEACLPAELCQWLRDEACHAPGPYRVHMQSGRGETCVFEVSCSRFQGEHEHGVQLLFNDVSERVAIAQRLHEQDLQLAQASHHKYEFLANISHELRTPLSSILILSQALQGNVAGNLSAKQVRHAGVIHRSGSGLLALINDLLELAKLNAGVVIARSERVVLMELLDSLEAKVRPLAEQKGVGLSVVVAPDMPSFFASDRRFLEQILRQLINNALKFTEQGAIELRVSCEYGSIPAVVKFDLQDSGIGIASEQQRKIFEAFYQVDSGTQRRSNGVGLGLSICQRLLALLQGSIEVSSQIGQGSIFSVRLPLQQTAVKSLAISLPTVSADSARTLAYSPLQGQRVLLLDADMRSLYSTTAQLDAYGVSVMPTGNVHSAVEALVGQGFDLVLIGASSCAIESVAEVIELCRARYLPVVALLDEPAEVRHLRKNGFTGSLTKPIAKEVLLELLQHYLPARRQHA